MARGASAAAGAAVSRAASSWKSTTERWSATPAVPVTACGAWPACGFVVTAAPSSNRNAPLQTTTLRAPCMPISPFRLGRRPARPRVTGLGLLRLELEMLQMPCQTEYPDDADTVA